MCNSEALEDQVVIMTDNRLEPEHSIASYAHSTPTPNFGKNERVPARFAGYVGGERA